ncbi:MAG: hypothetical protein K2Y37_00240 [Pirellulales bacterium]|nr:hypothetical protein [Pirellulales bacterium]
MPKRGKDVRQSGAKSPREARAVTPEGSHDWPLGAWLAGGAVYVGLFLATRLPSVEAVTGEVWRRWELALLALRPEDLWAAWTGGAGAWSMVDRVPIVGLVAAMLLVAAAAGDLLLRALQLTPSLTRAERVFFAATAGLNLLSLWTLGVGLAGQLAERAWWIVPGVGAAVAWIVMWIVDARRARSVSKPDVAPDQGAVGLSAERFATWWFVALAVPFAVVTALGGMLPPIEFDVREYHLQAPKEFYQRGRIEFLPHNVYANMPLGVEMHALTAMCLARDWWFGALVGKTISATFAPLTALGLFAAGRRMFSPTAGALAALVNLSIPWVAQVATLGLVEAGTGCYLLATLLAASRLAVSAKSLRRSFSIGDEPAPGATASSSSSARLHPALLGKPAVAPKRGFDAAESHPIGWTLFVGFLAGGALATKYPAAVFVVLPVGAWIVWSAWQQNPHRKSSNRSTAAAAQAHSALLDKPAVAPKIRRVLAAIVALVLYGAAVTAGGGLWLAKNWALSGNPVYPLAYDWLDGATRTMELNAQWQQAHRPPNFDLSDLVRRLGGFLLTSEWLSPLAWPLAALGAVLAWRDGCVKAWLGYVTLFFALWWLLTHRIDRFWVPVLPVVCLLAGGAAMGATTTARRRTLVALVGIGTVWSFIAVTSGIGGGDNRYLESLELLKNDPARLAPWHAYLNERTPPGKQVLAVGDAQMFDLEVSVLYNTVFDPSVFEELVRDERGQLRPAAELRERLRDVAFVYVNWGEIARYRSPGNYGFSDFVRPEVFARLVADGVLEPAVPEFANTSVQIFPVRR